MGLALVVAARVERAAQRADVAAVGRAVGHVVGFVVAGADHALAHPGGARRAASRDVVASAGGPGDERRGEQRGDQRDQRREGLRGGAEQAEVGRHRQPRGQPHRTDADRVDVVEVGALEFDARRRQAERLVDDQIGDHRHHPRDGDVGVQPQHPAQRLEHVELHQHQRDQGVEHHPHHAAGVAVGEAGEEVGPRQRAGVGVGDVDLELRDDDQRSGGGNRPFVVREHIFVGHQIHLVGVDRALGRHRMADRQIGQQRAAEHFEDAGNHPAGAADEHRRGPSPAVGGGALGHEAQVVHLLAHLGDQRDADGQRGAKGVDVEVAVRAVGAGVGHHAGEDVGILVQHIHEGHDQQYQPQRLGEHLQRADDGDAVGHQRNHHQRAQQIAPRWRDVEGQLQRVGHDRRFEGEEDEGEGGVDQRGDGRAEVAEAGAAGEQIHVQPVARGVLADRDAGEEDDQPGGEDRPQRVPEAVGHQQRAAHRFEHQKGRRAKGGVGHPHLRPLAKTARRKAQRVVFKRLARHPAVVVAAHLDDALRRRGMGAGWGRSAHRARI